MIEGETRTYRSSKIKYKTGKASKRQIVCVKGEFEGIVPDKNGGTIEVYRLSNGIQLKTKYRMNKEKYIQNADMAYWKTKEQRQAEKQKENPNASEQQKLLDKMGTKRYMAYLARKQLIKKLDNEK